MGRLRMIPALLLGFIFCSCGASRSGSSAARGGASDKDLADIRQAALDYVEGWYEGNVERMDRALHEELVKRRITGNLVATLDKGTMVGYTRSGGGTRYSGEKKNTVTILDVYNDVATVKADSAEYIDYLHVGKVDGRWVIINVLWTVKAKE
jgi:hypothetical protein